MMKLIFQSFGRLYALPCVVLFVIVPLISIRYKIILLNSQQCLCVITETMQTLLPICSVWWVYLMKREKLEGDGRELFRAYQPGWTEELVESLLCLVWFWIHIAVLLMVHAIWFSSMQWVFLQLLAESLLFTGLYLLVVNATGNTSISLMFLLIYYFLIAFLSVDTPIAKLSIFTLGEVASRWLLLHRYVWIAGLGGVFFLVGHWIGRKRPVTD
jgi:hypothetical protein